MDTKLDLQMFTGWLATGERGVSSETIVGVLTGVPLNQWTTGNHPYDPADFRRCEMLLRRYPLARLMFPKMRGVSVEWERLVDAWDELVALGEKEVPGVFDGPRPDGSAPRMFNRMRQILRGAS